MLLLSEASAFAQTDEIQVYDAEIAETGVLNLMVHNNYTLDGLTQPPRRAQLQTPAVQRRLSFARPAGITPVVIRGRISRPNRSVCDVLRSGPHCFCCGCVRQKVAQSGGYCAATECPLLGAKRRT